MQESEVLTQILSDYVKERPDLDKGPIENFCAYAGNWLCTRNIVGLGMTPEGMALRFGDGSEMTFFVRQQMPAIAVTPPVNVTGNAGIGVGGLVNAGKDDNGDVSITR
jgi:hypothetical protein